MRRRLLALVLLFVIVLPAYAVNLTVTAPNELASDADAICETVRLRTGTSSVGYNLNACAQLLFNAGLRQVKDQLARDVAQVAGSAAEANTYNTEMAVFNAAMAAVTPPTYFCGDSNTDTEFGEFCDDGGESATCDDDCTAVVCGDESINSTAGEQCDDGNTETGDGCDASCQTE